MSLVSGLGNLLSTGAGYLADGLGTVVDLGANALEYIPVVGDTLSLGVGSIGDAATEALQGNFGTALGDLYGGVDVLVGGVLPGGQAASQGYLSGPLSDLYGRADNALGGYLPNLGIDGTITPEAFQNAAKAAQGMTDAEMMHSGFSGMGGESKTGLSKVLDTAENIANLGQLGYGIYQMTQDSPEARNAAAYQRATGTTGTTRAPMLITPGVSTGTATALTPSRNVVTGNPAGFAVAKPTTGSIEVPNAPDLENVSDAELAEIAENAIIEQERRAVRNPNVKPYAGEVGQGVYKLNMFNRPVSNIPGGPKAIYLSK